MAAASIWHIESRLRLKVNIPEMESYLEAKTDKTENLQKFINKVKKRTELKELTLKLIREFIDRVIMYAPRYLDGKRIQVMDIYHNGIGVLWELSPEEMEEAFQEHLEERERNKVKTA